MIKSNELLNVRVGKYITDLIKKGRLKEGDRLLPIGELSKMFKSSPMPIRQATANLVKNGVLEKVRGKGTFVRRSPFKVIRKITDKIGVLYWPRDINFYQSSFYGDIMAGIKLQAEREEKLLMFKSLREMGNGEKMEAGVYNMLENVDGFIFVEMLPSMRDTLVDAIRQLEKPAVVLINEDLPPDIDTISFNHADNMKQLVDFLINEGHRRIGYISRRSRFYGNNRILEDLKVDGYRAALEQAGIMYDEKGVLYMDFEHGDQHLPAFKELMSGDNPPTALCCIDDSWALYVYRMAHQLGISIPDDLSIVGYNDVAEARHAVPQMTTLQLPLLEMGAMSVKRLLEKQGKAGEELTATCRITLPGKVIPRESHKKIK